MSRVETMNMFKMFSWFRRKPKDETTFRSGSCSISTKGNVFLRCNSCEADAVFVEKYDPQSKKIIITNQCTANCKGQT